MKKDSKGVSKKAPNSARKAANVTKTDKKSIDSRIKPLQDRILIRELIDSAETVTKSGIIIPITVGDDKGSKRGTVVAVGPGHYEGSKLIPVSVKIGDTVLFQWGDKIKVDGEEFFLVREPEILAVAK